MKTEQISIRLTSDQLQAIDAIAASTVGERSDHIRKALDEYIAQYRQANEDEPLSSESVRTVLSKYFDSDGLPYAPVA